MADVDQTEAIRRLGRNLRTARNALWAGNSGKAFTAIEEAQVDLNDLKEAINDPD